MAIAILRKWLVNALSPSSPDTLMEGKNYRRMIIDPNQWLKIQFHTANAKATASTCRAVENLCYNVCKTNIEIQIVISRVQYMNNIKQTYESCYIAIITKWIWLNTHVL